MTNVGNRLSHIESIVSLVEKLRRDVAKHNKIALDCFS